MMRFYFDDSADGAREQVFVLAGYFASAEKWSAFDKEWKELLDMSPAMQAFKMSRRTSAADLQRNGWFYKVIERHVDGAFACLIRIPELRRALASVDIPAGYTNVDKLPGQLLAVLADEHRRFVSEDLLGEPDTRPPVYADVRPVGMR
jgi:hypothetical protein